MRGKDARWYSVPTASHTRPEALPFAWWVKHRRAARFQKRKFSKRKLDGRGYRGTQMAKASRVVGAYIDAASAAIVEMGGKVAKKLGDGLMALFGYPVAQENDAERAVRAALAIQRSLAELNRENEGTDKPALAARIAVNFRPGGGRYGGRDFR